MTSRATALLAIMAAVAMAAVACAVDRVVVPVPRTDPTTLRWCRALHDRLPYRVKGAPRRPTRPDSPQVAAWGSPAIALRCGVNRPRALTPTSELVVVDGLPWLPEPPNRPTRFTTYGLRAYVELTVPPAYAPAGEVLGELGPAIKATIPDAPGD